jgi:Ca-activated chloride channel homolog
MNDELDQLRAAMKAATPAPDAGAREVTLRLALENFDRAQGSFGAVRPTEDRPVKAGLFSGVFQMIRNFTTRQMLAGTASAAAVVVGIVAVGPMLLRGPEVERAVPEAVVGSEASTSAAVAEEGTAEVAVEPPAPAPMTELTEAETGTALEQPAAPDTGGMTDAEIAAEILADVERRFESETNDTLAEAASEPVIEEAAPQANGTNSTQFGDLSLGYHDGARTEVPSAAAPVAPAPTGDVTTTMSGRFGIISDGDADALAQDSEVDALTYQPAPTELARRTREVSADGAVGDLPDAPPPVQIDGTEAFATAAPNPVKVTVEEPVSTFSIDVDTASYAVVRQSLNAGQLPPVDAVRIEEMVNYFPYASPAPDGDGAPFRPTVTVMPTPWNFSTRLVHIAVQGEMPEVEARPPLNLVFLIDTSGSMDEPNKLPLLRNSLALMVDALRPEDQVAIVAYAGSAGTVLEPVVASDKDAILAALDNLAAGGSTAGAEGLALAYQVAATMAGDGEVSRVILATDGDFNVGVSDPEGLEAYVAKQRETGVYLSVLGFGRGNLDDAVMQSLAQNGNGQAAYIDTLSEARKVLVDQLTGALFPIADDVKIQVEWNPAQVAEYRLIGYETRSLRREDFNNDRVDAGEIGAGIAVTAIYEVTAPGSDALLNDPLRYGAAGAADAGGEMGFLRLRYKEPGDSASELIEVPIVAGDTAPSDEARFAAAIAGFGQLLTGATYLGDWGWDDAIALGNGARGDDPFGYRAEAVNLMRLAKSLER